MTDDVVGRASSLNASRRARELEWLADNAVDLAVVGGGITGVGVALDAASRGLSVALFERGDLASGTSRFSSKLVHGGLRYLMQGRPGLAWECARERATLLAIAPHLVRPMPIVVPLTDSSPRGMKTAVSFIWRTGNLMRAAARTSRQLLPPPRRIGRAEAQTLVPGLRTQGLRGGLLSWDAQLEDDARLVIAVARTAASYGARILTYCAVERIAAGEVSVRDALTGATLDVRARHVVNAAGVWADRLASGVSLQPSKGSHVVVHAEALGSPRAALFAPERWGRFIFGLPTSDERVLIGLTDEPFEGEPPEEPAVEPSEEEHLLGVISAPLARPVTRADVIGRFAGTRPLLASGGRSTADLSREHAVIEDEQTGAVTVVGGKLTTYRAMAEDALRALAARGGLELRPSRTRALPLVGAAPREELDKIAAPARLRRRYGLEALALVDAAKRDADALERVLAEDPTLRIELRHGIQHEGALTASDLVDRRTRLGLIDGQRLPALEVGEQMLAEWDHARTPSGGSARPQSALARPRGRGA
jgi:glycerol-3-phosphate dehydrogenase